MQMITDHTFIAGKASNICAAGIGGGQLCYGQKYWHQSEQPDLDGARDEAVNLLRKLIQIESYYEMRGSIHLAAGNKLNDIARQYVTAQARYTNMLQEWEKANEPDL